MTTFIIMALIGAFMGLVLAIASDVFKVEVDVRQATVEEMLPGYNCGACGCPGCAGMAEKIMAEEINLKACRPSKQDQLDAIAEYLASTPDSAGNVVKTKM